VSRYSAVGHACARELVERGLDHRLQVGVASDSVLMSAARTICPSPTTAERCSRGRIGATGFFDDLARDLLEAARGVMGGRRRDLRAVDRDNTDLDQAAARAERQHLPEQLGDRRLVAHAKPRDGGVIGHVVGGDDPKRDVVATAPLDAPRRRSPIA
jgi:hypothetical protein